MLTTPQPTFADIQAAAARIRGHARHTPLLESEILNQRLGGRLLVKAECLQRIGAFKFRGAFNAIAVLKARQLGASGVVAYSSGNHAQGVALAAKLMGLSAVIVMPADAPQSKLENTRALGAEVVTYDRLSESRDGIAQQLATERGLHLIRPYDDADVIAGQGTIGVEIAEDAEALAIGLDAVIVPVGGGGLASGVALALAKLSPDTAVFAAEPEGFDDTRRSLAAGERVANAGGGQSICDALMAPTPGELTFAILKDRLAGGFAVGEDQVLAAMAAAFEHFKVVVEPGGAVALAAVLGGKMDVRGKTVCCVLSGGNVDAEVFRRALAPGAGALTQLANAKTAPD